MPEVFYLQLRRHRRRAALSVTAFVLTWYLLPLALIAFRRYHLLGTALLGGCAALVLVCYRVRRVPPDAPELYSAPILGDDPTARLAACGAEQVGADAQVLFATDGRLHARVLALECDDFAAQRMKAIFCANGFTITYPREVTEEIGDGFFFSLSYPGLTGGELVTELMHYGVSSINLDTTGSLQPGVRACTSRMREELYPVLEERMRQFHADHPF